MRGGVRGRARLTSTGLPTSLRVDRTRRMGVQQPATPTTIAMTTTIGSRRRTPRSLATSRPMEPTIRPAAILRTPAPGAAGPIQVGRA